MKISRVLILILVAIVLILILFTKYVGCESYHDEPNIINEIPVEADSYETPATSIDIEYVSLDVPNVNSYFKAWMDYRAVTNRQSAQYKFIHTWAWADSQGFMRASAERDLGVEDDYYLVALGSYYGTQIGTKYRFTTNTGNVFYGVLGDCKANAHTNATNQYSRNYNVVEFIVDSKTLNSNVKRMGSANVYMPLNGNIVKIERMDFVTK